MKPSSNIESLILEETIKEVNDLYEKGDINQEQLNELMAGLQAVASGLAGAAKNVASGAASRVGQAVTGAANKAAGAVKSAYQAGEEKKRQQNIVATREKVKTTIQKTFADAISQTKKTGDNQLGQLLNNLGGQTMRQITNVTSGFKATGGKEAMPRVSPEQLQQMQNQAQTVNIPPTNPQQNTVQQPMQTMRESFQSILEETIKNAIKQPSSK